MKAIKLFRLRSTLQKDHREIPGGDTEEALYRNLCDAEYHLSVGPFAVKSCITDSVSTKPALHGFGGVPDACARMCTTTRHQHTAQPKSPDTGLMVVPWVIPDW
jgi:hypothetical protein